MLGSRSDNARLQSDFYRDQYRKVLKWLFAAILIVFVLLAVIVYLILFRQPQKYYANTTEGRIISMPNVARNSNGS